MHVLERTEPRRRGRAGSGAMMCGLRHAAVRPGGWPAVRRRGWTRLRLSRRLRLRRGTARPAEVALPAAVGPQRRGAAPDAAGLRARTDHAPADAHQRHAALDTARAKARGTSAARSGNCRCDFRRRPARVSVAGQTITAPFSAMSCRVTRERSSGAAVEIKARPARRAERDQRRQRLVAGDDRERPPGAAREAVAEELPHLGGRAARPADRPRQSTAGSRSPAPPAAAAARSAPTHA